MRISTRCFSYNKHTNAFVAEISDFSDQEEGYHRLSPIACDIGLTLISEKTGGEADYYHYKDVYTEDEDHEFSHTILLPTSKTIRQFPTLKGSKVIIIND